MRNFLIQHWKVLSDIAGTLFSFAGLIVSAFAMGYAKSAKTLAKEATEAVRKVAQTRTLHEYLSDSSRIASDISKYIDLEQPEMALHSARETLRLALFIGTRWEPELAPATKKSLSAAKVQLDIIIDVLLKGPINALGKTAKASLRRSAQSVTNVFTEELGLVTRIREGVEDNA
jgi:hypothetical protein